MKKITVLLASLFVLFSTTDAFARGFLIDGGLNFPKFDIKNINSFSLKTYTGWHAGIGYQTGRALGFSFQPELNFVRNSVGVEENMGTVTQVITNMLQLTPNVQWGIDLLVCKPFLFLAPYASLNLGNSLKNATAAASELIGNAKKLDYGFGAGLGLNVWKVQVTAKYNWSFGNVLNWSEYYSQMKNVKLSNGGFVLSAALIF